MSLLVMIFRKIIKNKWLNLCLLTGLVISVALISSIPMYTEGVLQRLLTGELEQFQTDKYMYPGSFFTKVNVGADSNMEYRRKIYDIIHNKAWGKSKDFIGLPSVTEEENRIIDYLCIYRNPDGKLPDKPDESLRITTMKLESYNGIEDRVDILDGKFPSKEPVDGVIEIMLTQDALEALKLVIGNEYLIASFFDDSFKPVRVRPVGLIIPKDKQDPYWQLNRFNMKESIIVNDSLFEKTFMKDSYFVITHMQYYFALNYRAITIRNIKSVIEKYDAFSKWSQARSNLYQIEFPANPILEKYFDKEKQLKMMLWALNAPVIIMLCFYIFMVSTLMIERQKTEIAVLRSRGASRLQVIFSYFLESSIMGGIVLLLAPPVGLLLCRILGYSGGFLEFVSRASLPVSLNLEAYLYAFLGVSLSIIMMLAPAYNASKSTIVGHKQKMARTLIKPLWQRYFVDIAFIVIALYGFYNFSRRQKDLAVTAAKATDLQIDPLLFFIPAIFVFGAGLFLLRMYPLFLKGIYWVGKRIFTPAVYASILQVGRSSVQYHFIMIFMAMTIAMGLFSANAARTINNNAEEKIKYITGADIRMKVEWENDKPADISSGEEGGEGEEQEPALPVFNKKVQYIEPPISIFESLDGISNVARVFIQNNAQASAGKKNKAIELMGIEPSEFSKVAWFRSGLLPSHWHNYLNLITGNSGTCLISASLGNDLGVKPGDRISISWTDGKMDFLVSGIINYWPSWNPNKSSQDKNAPEPSLVVANINYIQDNTPLQPYEIWMKKEENATSGQVFKSIEANKIRVESIMDAGQEIVKLKNNPFYLGINGAMSMGFIIVIIISFLGFLLYWILSLGGRTLQFGVLRAIGMRFRQIMEMLVWEQLLSSGVAILLGIGIGNLTSRFFVPLFQISYNANEQVPPFRVLMDVADRNKLYIIMGIMLFMGISILSYMLSRIRIHQAIKLGEDQ